MIKKFTFPALLLLLALTDCRSKHKINQHEDELYSRHLQRHVKLSIISTPMPDDKTEMNLLLLNDGQDMAQLGVKETLDSLYKNGLIRPLLIVGIQAGDRMQEYGVAGYPDFLNRGSKAGFYDDFINNELYPYAKKNATVRKFRSVAIAGCSLGGLSAFDIAWNRAGKIDKVGVFSGSFWWRDTDDKAADYSDEKNRIIFTKLKASRKKPALKYWFYAGGKEEDGDRDKDGIIDVVDDTKDLVALIKSKTSSMPGDITYTEDPNGKHDHTAWRKQFAAFLVWGFGR